MIVLCRRRCRSGRRALGISRSNGVSGRARVACALGVAWVMGCRAGHEKKSSSQKAAAAGGGRRRKCGCGARPRWSNGALFLKRPRPSALLQSCAFSHISSLSPNHSCPSQDCPARPITLLSSIHSSPTGILSLHHSGSVARGPQPAPAVSTVTVVAARRQGTAQLRPPRRACPSGCPPPGRTRAASHLTGPLQSSPPKRDPSRLRTTLR